MAFSARYIDKNLGGIDYGTAASLTATPGAYTSLYAKEIVANLDHNMLDVEIQKSDAARGLDPAIVGAEMGTIGFKVPWRAGKLSGGTGATSLIATLAQYCGMDLHNLAGGVDKITGGSASTVEMADGDDPGFAVGDFILVNADESGTPDRQLRYITRVESAAGTTTLTVTPDFDTTPVNLDTFYPCDTLVPNPIPIVTLLGLDVYRGEGSPDRHKMRALGCAGKFVLEEVESGGIPWAAFEYIVGGGWTASEESRANVSDIYAPPPLFLTDAFYLDDTQVHLKSVSFDPGCNPIAIPGQTATGIQWFKYGDPRPAMSFNPLFDNQFFTDWAAGTIRKAFLQRVVDQYQAWGIMVPGLQVMKAGEDAEFTDGIAGAGLTTRITDPGENADSVQYPLFSIAFAGV